MPLHDASRWRCHSFRMSAGRLRLEILEDRLPPGDAVLSSILGLPSMGATAATTPIVNAAALTERRGTAEQELVVVRQMQSGRDAAWQIPLGTATTDGDPFLSESVGTSAQQPDIGFDVSAVSPPRRTGFAQSSLTPNLRSSGSALGMGGAIHSSISHAYAANLVPPNDGSLRHNQQIAGAVSATTELNPAASTQSSANHAEARTQLGQLPLTFEANEGQAAAPVKFVSRVPGYTVLLTNTSAIMHLTSESNPAVGSVVQFQLAGANSNATPVGLDQQVGTVNYFRGGDPSQWRIGVPTFSRVAYDDVYPGVDLVYYGNQHQLEYDFIVAPGANPGAIHFNVMGAESPFLDANGNLIVSTPAGPIVQHRPVLYQEIGAVRHDVTGQFIVRGQQVSFEIGAYDRSQPLVIDPTLSYSTYLGGSGDDKAHGVAVDSAGDIYVAGSTTSLNFPAVNPYQGTFGGGLADAFVTKLNPDGTAVLYSTYLGGSGEDEAFGVAVDGSGSAYVVGNTASTNFPTTTGALQRTFGGGDTDAFVTKLSPDGRSLVYSTYLGGAFDEDGSGIAVDSSGNAYVTGDTTSLNYPTTASGFQRTLLGDTAGFVSKINSTGSALLYSTYLGGPNNPDFTGGNDYAAAIALDGTGNVYVTGGTTSLGFPTTPGAFQTTFGVGGNGEMNAFISKINPTLSGNASLVYSTFLGGTGTDCGAGIAVDGSGSAYVTGDADSIDFPTRNAFQPTNGGGDSDAYITKLNAAGSALVYSSYLGGLGADEGLAVAVDGSGNAYITGDTTSSNFPVLNPLQGTRPGLENAFVTKVSAAGALAYSTYLGGAASDDGGAIAVDSSQNVYVAGQTTSTNFPTTPGAYQTSSHGATDAFIAKVSDTTANPATHFLVNPAAGSVVAGNPFSITVTALDANNQPVPSYRGTVSFTSSDNQASLPGSYMFTATDAGSHTFTNLFTLRTAGAQTITVTDGSINGSAPITVLPGGASILQLSSLPSSSRAGSSFDITVTAFDGYGNVATGYQGTVTFSSSDGGAILPANYPFSAADAGIHRFASGGTLITAGIQSLAVADVAGGITGATANVTVTPAPAALFMLTAPGTVIPGVPFDITVAALDPYGNVDVNYLGTIAFASSDPDPGVLLPPNYSFQPTDLGMAIFPGGGTLITLGQQTISATDVNSGITGSVSVLVSGGDQPNPGRRLRIPGTSLDVVQRTRQTRAIRTATPPVATAIEAAGSMGGAAEGRLPEIVRQLGPLVEPDMPDPLADGWLI